MGVESYVVHCDLVTGSYLGSQPGDALFSVPLGSSNNPNTQMTYSAVAATPMLPVATRQISSITIYITHSARRLISLRGEPITVVLALEAVC
jgi:hypothetical protein